MAEVRRISEGVMKHRSLVARATSVTFVLLLTLVTQTGVGATVSRQPSRQPIPPFLYPPFPGSTSAERIFDH